MEPLPIRAKDEKGMVAAALFRLGYLIGLRESAWPDWAERFDLGLSLVKLDYHVSLTAIPHGGADPVHKRTVINALRIKTIDDLDVTLWQLYIAVKYTVLKDKPPETKQPKYRSGGQSS